jgi:RimJ/RimL family protein N-acetyltransferase
VRISEIILEVLDDEISRGMSQLTPEQIVAFSKRSGAKIFVCVNEKDEVVGFLTFTEGSVEYPSQVHLAGVTCAFRRKGIGRQLVQEALKQAKAVGRAKVKLFTRPWNIAMRKICAELGFVPEAYLRKDFLGEDIILYSVFL